MVCSYQTLPVFSDMHVIAIHEDYLVSCVSLCVYLFLCVCLREREKKVKEDNEENGSGRKQVWG